MARHTHGVNSRHENMTSNIPDVNSRHHTMNMTNARPDVNSRQGTSVDNRRDMNSRHVHDRSDSLR